MFEKDISNVVWSFQYVLNVVSTKQLPKRHLISCVYICNSITWTWSVIYNLLSNTTALYKLYLISDVLECIMSPRFIGNLDIMPDCINPILEKFGVYFPSGNITSYAPFETLYRTEVKPNNGAAVYVLVYMPICNPNQVCHTSQGLPNE